MGVSNSTPWRSVGFRKQPCKPDCPRRSATCHSDCPDYAKFTEAQKAEYERRVLRIQSTPIPKSYNGNSTK